MKKLIYTVHFGQYDNLWEPTFIAAGWDHVVVTDNIYLKSKYWNVVYYKETLPPWLLARKVKILFNELFAEYDMSIYIDGSIQITNYIDAFVKGLGDFSVTTHPERECVYDEIEACVRHLRLTREKADELKKRYRAEGIPERQGLYQCDVIVRNHRNEKVQEFCTRWYEETKKAQRDQIAFMHTLHYYPIEITPFTVGELRKYTKKYLHLNGM